LAGAFSFTIVILEPRDGIQRLIKKKNLLIVNEEALFFVLGVRHYGALEEDVVARMTPCRAFCKMHQFTLRNFENELEPFVLKFTNPYTPKGDSFSFFTCRKILF
jgi:hypothetical protein